MLDVAAQTEDVVVGAYDTAPATDGGAAVEVADGAAAVEVAVVAGDVTGVVVGVDDGVAPNAWVEVRGGAVAEHAVPWIPSGQLGRGFADDDAAAVAAGVGVVAGGYEAVVVDH